MGVHQGSVVRPFLFTAVMDRLTIEIMSPRGLRSSQMTMIYSVSREPKEVEVYFREQRSESQQKQKNQFVLTRAGKVEQ